MAPLRLCPYLPDVVVFTLDPEEAEIALRAISYDNGKIWQSMLTPVMGCAWICIYSYITGEMNYMVTTLVHGMKARKVFPDGKIVIAIPFDLLDKISRNLKKMRWKLKDYSRSRDENVKEFENIIRELYEEFGI